MDEETTYRNFHVRLAGTPEQFAAFLIDWCRESYRVIGLVPRITLNEDGSVGMVEGIQAERNLLLTHTFNDAFEVLNGKTPAEFALAPGHRYLHRLKGTVEGRWRPASQYHKPDKDYTTSVCGAVSAGGAGYEIVFKTDPVPRTMLCTHCARGTKTRQGV